MFFNSDRKCKKSNPQAMNCTKTENMSASALKTHVKDDAQIMQFFGVWKNETFV